MDNKDSALLEFIIEGTRAGRIRWELTANLSTFTTSFKGKYSVLVFPKALRDPETGDLMDGFVLKLTDGNEQELLGVTSLEDVRIAQIHYLARRAALNVDTAIDEIMEVEDH